MLLVTIIWLQNFERLWPYTFITNIKVFSDNNLVTNFLHNCEHVSKVTTIELAMEVLVMGGDDIKN